MIQYPIINAFLKHRIKKLSLHKELIQEIIKRYNNKRKKTIKIAKTWSQLFKFW